jgi:hypothetical protein
MVQEIADGSNLSVEDAGLPFARPLRVKRRGGAKAKAKKEVR